jgi:UDP-N-acetylmuramyl tripeptide synthase
LSQKILKIIASTAVAKFNMNITFYKVRSLRTGNWLAGASGFFSKGRDYKTKAAAKGAYTSHKKRNDYYQKYSKVPLLTDPAEIVEFLAKEVGTDRL